MSFKKVFAVFLCICSFSVLFCMETPVPYIERTVLGSPFDMSSGMQEAIGNCAQQFYEISKTVRPDAISPIKTPLAQKVNIAQLVIHVVFDDNSIISIPILSKMTGRKSESFYGLFYLSGSEGMQIGLRQKQLFAGNFASHCREIVNTNKTILFIQREQPEYERLLHRFMRLSTLEGVFFPFGSFTKELLKIRDIATGCQSQINIIYERSDFCLIEMQKELENLQRLIPQPLSFSSLSRKKFPAELTLTFPGFSLMTSNIEILKKMIACLQVRDFSFSLLPKEYSLTYSDLINKTSLNLYKGSDPKVLFNSKECNFYCSEQLLLDEEFGNEIRVGEISKLVEQAITQSLKKATDLVVQIDSTKFTCKICTVDIVQNTLLPGGYINNFFQLFSGIPDDRKIVNISYHEPYVENMGYRIATQAQYSEIFRQPPKVYIMEVK